MTDILSLINDTRRELGYRQTDDGEARYLVIRRHYDTPVEDVWQACTDPLRISRWLRPITGDLRLGGAYQLEDNAGGEILRCEPPHLLVLTWFFGPRAEGDSSVVELRLSPTADGGTEFVLDHAAVFDMDQATWMENIGYFGAGWETATTYLGKYLQGELPDAPVTEWYDPTAAEDVERDQQVIQVWGDLAKATMPTRD